MKRKEMSLDEIRRAGTEALCERLGPLGMVRFLQQFDTGSGNYSQERSTWLGSLQLSTIIEEIERNKKS